MTAETASAPVPAMSKASEPSSLYQDAIRHLMQKRSAIVGMLMLLFLALVALLAPVIAPFDPEEQLIGVEEGIKKRSPPCIHALGCPEDRPQHIFGVDANFRDFFSRMLYGARLSLMVGFAAVTFAIVSGTILGSVAGFVGGWLDNVIMRLMDVFLAFPALILAIAIVTVLGPGLIKRPIGHQYCDHSGLCPSHSLQRINGQSPGFYSGRRGPGRASHADSAARCFAERHQPPDCARHARYWHGHRRGSGSVLPGPGGAAAHPGVGSDGQRGTEPGLYRALPGLHSRRSHRYCSPRF